MFKCKDCIHFRLDSNGLPICMKHKYRNIEDKSMACDDSMILLDEFIVKED